MKTLMKSKIVLAVLALIMICCSFLMINTVNANAAEKQGFTIEDGASIKVIKEGDEYSQKSGMSFALKLSASVYGELVENGAYKDGVEIGMLLLPESLKTGDLTYQASLTDANIYKASISVEKWKADDEIEPTEYTSWVYVYDFDSKYFNETVCAKGYVVSGSDVFETASYATSMAEVALSAKESIDQMVGSEQEKENLLNLINAYISVPYSVTFKNGETTVETQTITYGNKVEEIQAPEAPNGYEFTGWLYNGKAWDFANDTVKGNMELTASFKETFVTLTQADVANFQSIIESNMAGTYYLGEDLDFTGVTFKSIGGVESNANAITPFTGVLDGKGFAIKNLTISGRAANDQWGVPLAGASNLIAQNNGTVKNLYIQVTMANRVGYVGIIGNNNGTVNNLFADITLTGNMTGSYAQMNGGIVGKLNAGGTVKNCIVNINASALSGSQIFGTVVGATYSGAEYPIANCYAITNGLTVGYAGGRDVLYGEHYGAEIRKPKNSANYADAVAFFTAVKELSTANGWGSYWTLANNTLKFGDETVVDLAGITLLTQEDVANFQSIIESNMAGTYYLGEDLDFTGVTFKSIGGTEAAKGTITPFTGVLDGKGFAIKNLTISGRAGTDQWSAPLAGASNLIAQNDGTVKNLYVQATMASKTNFVGLIGSNNGTVNNLFADITLTGNMTGAYAQMSGGIVARLNSGGTVKNCIVNINASALSGNQVFGTVVGATYSGAEYPIANNYAITNGFTPSYAGGRDVLYGEHYGAEIRKPKNCANYADAKTLVESVTLSTANGWSEYWSLANGVLSFGDEVIYSAQ